MEASDFFGSRDPEGVAYEASPFLLPERFRTSRDHVAGRADSPTLLEVLEALEPPRTSSRLGPSLARLKRLRIFWPLWPLLNPEHT